MEHEQRIFSSISYIRYNEILILVSLEAIKISVLYEELACNILDEYYLDKLYLKYITLGRKHNFVNCKELIESTACNSVSLQCFRERERGWGEKE